MNNRWGLLAVALALVAMGGAVILILVPAPKPPIGIATSTPPSSIFSSSTLNAGIADLITIDSPVPGDTVGSSSVVVSGSARGSWYFEASFPVELLDAGGTVLAQGPAQAQSDWMTTDFVAFTATLSYPPQPHGAHGTLILKNDNPSGDPARAKEVSIPVVFN
jgi:hypothetical protein